VSRFRNILARLQGQLWILPALISIGAAALAIWLLTHGASLMRATGRDVWWLYSGDAGTARGLLSGLLSGMITMTSLIVSVTFVILTLAANQLGPRLIGIFVRDRQIQSVLGLFLGTILYVIIVFRTLDDTLGPEGVPHLAVTVASALTVLCVFALLFYIHKIARSIIADNVVEAAAMSLRRDVRQILRPDSEEAPAEPLVGTRTPISLGRWRRSRRRPRTSSTEYANSWRSRSGRCRPASTTNLPHSRWWIGLEERSRTSSSGL
jgi:uncharacterized membrane protein